ncbi:hypothetical protein [Streptomyces sp. WZ.A104]|uniref:hypothetical protein n=1 Tax=Streptomyces sp. WZ.A104 TaxID=2023771 RepID=UPI0015CBDA93|nr:hypothetical protein [Streptomyces sp. WZ.A104]
MILIAPDAYGPAGAKEWAAASGSPAGGAADRVDQHVPARRFRAPPAPDVR